MTAAALTPSIEYIENGATTAFAVPFRFVAPTHVIAKRIAADGTVTALIYGSDYSVSGGGTDAGGTLTVAVAGVAGTRLNIRRVTPRAQDLDYTTNDNFPAESHELGLDKAMLIDQEQDTKIDDTALRALMVPDGETVATVPDKVTRAGKFMGFGAGGEPVALSGTGNDSALRTDLAGANGHSLVGFTQPDPGARTRGLGDKAMDYAVSILDFGTVAEVTADVTGALAEAVAALGAAGGEIIFPAGITYYFATEATITAKANIRFTGWGATISGAAVRSYFNLISCTNIRFEGFDFDSRFGELATYTNFADGEKQVPVRGDGCTFIAIERNRFRRLYTEHVFLKNSSYITIANNSFSSPVQDQDQRLSFVEMLTCGGSVRIERNDFINAPTTRSDRCPSAVTFSGISGNIAVLNNRIEHCGRNNAGTHRLAAIDCYADAARVHVENNTALDCHEQFMRLSTCAQGRVRGNFVTTSIYADITYSCMTIESGSFPAVANPVCIDIEISRNSFIDVGNRQAFCIGVGSYDWGAAAKNIRISRNYVQGQANAFEIWGPYDGIEISKNMVRDTLSVVKQVLIGGAPTTAVLGTEANARYDNLLIEANDVVLRAGSPSVPINLATDRASPFTGTVGTVTVRDNAIKCAGPATTYAISALLPASVATKKGRVLIRNNNIEGYTKPFYLRSMLRATLRDNHAIGMTQLYDTDGTVDLIEASGNRRTDGLMAAQAVLVAGVATINTPEILAGDRIEVWRETAGGTTGQLYADPADIVAGTSFKVRSTNALDTSTIGCRIVSR